MTSDNGEDRRFREASGGALYPESYLRGSSFEPFPLFEGESQHPQQETQFQHQHTSMEKKRAGDDMLTIGRRKKKNKGMPKRPMSAYALFFSHERAKLLEFHRDGASQLCFDDLEKAIRMRWNNLSPAQRQDYEVLSSEDCARYRSEMEAFNEGKKKQDVHSHDEGGVAGSQKLQDEYHDREVFSRPHQPFVAKNDPPQDRFSPPFLSAPQRLDSRHNTSDDRGSRSAVAPSSLYGAKDQQLTYGTTKGHSPPPPAFYPPENHRYLHEPPPPPPSPAQNNLYLPPQSGGRVRQSSTNQHPPASSGSPMILRDLFPIPPGMELMLPDRTGRDRRYKVEYHCYTMTREAANAYMERLAAPLIVRGAGHQQPQPRQQQG